MQVARELTQGSAVHQRLFALLGSPGTLTLSGRLDLAHLLQPAIQPGAAIDWVRPPESVRVRFESNTALDGGGTVSNTEGLHRREWAFEGPGTTRPAFEIRLATGPGPRTLIPTWSTALQPDRWRPFPLLRFLASWSEPPGTTAEPTGPRSIPEIAGGNWLHGRRLFFGDRLSCARCHALRGEGAHVGPELSNLLHRDHASVRKDIQFPDATLNPDHLASVVERTDGTESVGILQREADGVLHLATAGGPVESIPRSQVRAVRPAAQSLMPEGLWDLLSSQEQKDLMTFLLTVPLEPATTAPEAQGQPRPPTRRCAEFEGMLPATASPGPRTESPLRIVLCASPKDPGHAAPGFHDYPLWRDRWATLLGLADGVSVETAERWPSAEQWGRADVVAFYHDNPAWVADRAADLDAFLARGGGLVFLHWSMNAFRDPEALKQRLGRSWAAGAKFRYGPEELHFNRHPLTEGFPNTARITDEAYWNLPGSDAGSTVLATSSEDSAPTPQVWVRESGRGRIFVCIPGHFTWTFDDPLYRVLLLRGIAWTAHQPVDRLLELVPVGARFGE